MQQLSALESLASTPHAAREFYVALALLNYRLTRAWPYPILEHIHGPAQWLGFLLAVTAFVCVFCQTVRVAARPLPLCIVMLVTALTRTLLVNLSPNSSIFPPTVPRYCTSTTTTNNGEAWRCACLVVQATLPAFAFGAKAFKHSDRPHDILLHHTNLSLTGISSRPSIFSFLQQRCQPCCRLLFSSPWPPLLLSRAP